MEACSTHEADENAYKFLGRKYLQDLRVDRRIILR
jgi:hypothetical protein